MTQSRKLSAIENITRAIVGLFTGGTLHYVLYHHMQGDLYFVIVPVAFFVHSVVLGYVFRRAFNA